MPFTTKLPLRAKLCALWIRKQKGCVWTEYAWNKKQKQVQDIFQKEKERARETESKKIKGCLTTHNSQGQCHRQKRNYISALRMSRFRIKCLKKWRFPRKKNIHRLTIPFMIYGNTLLLNSFISTHQTGCAVSSRPVVHWRELNNV